MTKSVTFCVLNTGGGWVGPLFRTPSIKQHPEICETQCFSKICTYLNWRWSTTKKSAVSKEWQTVVFHERERWLHCLDQRVNQGIMSNHPKWRVYRREKCFGKPWIYRLQLVVSVQFLSDTTSPLTLLTPLGNASQHFSASSSPWREPSKRAPSPACYISQRALAHP